MFTKNKKSIICHIKKRYEFIKLQRHGIRFQSKFITLIIKSSKQCGRFGITVSKSIGKAHVRNLIKRKLRHALQLQFDSCAILKNYNVIILAVQQIKNASFRDIEKDIKYAYGKLRSYNWS